MFGLSAWEVAVFSLVVAAHAAGAAIAALELAGSRRRYGSLLAPVVLAAVALDAVLLGLRGMSIRAVPLTGLFESLLVLSLVFGVLYLSLRSTIEQVWFGTIMVWAMLGMIVAGAFVAGPPSRPQALAATPWAVAHGSLMILASAAVVFAAANAGLYLLGSYRLKHKGIMQVLGRIPNLETLARMNRLGVRVGFVLLTIGMLSGLGLTSLLGTGIARWLADSKVICILGAWGLLGTIVLLDRLRLLKIKARAYATLAAFGLILVAILGVTIAGATRHKFSMEEGNGRNRAGCATHIVSVSVGTAYPASSHSTLDRLLVWQ
jgi:ABC-type uncharacterized transport system permease subunit